MLTIRGITVQLQKPDRELGKIRSAVSRRRRSKSVKPDRDKNQIKPDRYKKNRENLLEKKRMFRNQGTVP